MMVVKRKMFINAKEQEINAFLSQIPAENIVSTHFAVHGFEGSSDEWTTIFYKDERWVNLNESI